MEFTSKKQSRFGRVVRLGAVAMAVTAMSVGGLLTATGTTQAATTLYATPGYSGLSSVVEPGATCTNTSSGRLVSVRPPRILARNVTNAVDSQWVHFRSHLIDRDGQILATTGWSAWAKAFDNSSAQFSGTQDFTVSSPSVSVRVAIEVEWFNAASVLQVVSNYQLRGYTYYLIGIGWVPYPNNYVVANC